MRNLRNWLMCLLVSVTLLAFAGCGSELATGAAGVGGGFAASETFAGIQADLDRRKAQLVADYQAAVEAGAKKEVLDELESDIKKTEDIKVGVETTKRLLGIDWNNPTQAGSGVGLIATLAYAILTKRRLNDLQLGVNTFQGKQDPDTAGKLHDAIKAKRRTV